MNLQLQSIFFGRLPQEVRDIIYTKFWEVSGFRQHVFEHDGVVTHFPCALVPGEEDSRNKEFERVWNECQGRRAHSTVYDGKWSRRMASTWNDHWKCEEAMLMARREEKRTGSLFQATLLTCKRMHQEALPSLYASTTLVLSSLPLAQALFVTSPSPNISLLRSLHLSLCVPYTTLHYHKYVSSPPGQLLWAELCTTLSNLYRFAALRDVVLRLDLTDDNRFWWEVHETWALSPVQGMLRRGMVLQLPEITADVPRMREYQFAPPTSRRAAPEPYCPAPRSVAPSPGSGDQPTGGTPPQEDREQDTPVARRGGGRSLADQNRAPSDDFGKFERYPRRRWACEGGGDAVQARLEFFNPQEHTGLEPETKIVKMRGLLRGMLIC